VTTLRSVSILLGSANPSRLRTFYEHVFNVKPDPNGWLQLGTVAVLIDPRSDVSQSNPDPGRFILNIDTDNAAAIVERLQVLRPNCTRGSAAAV
jgi:hypothetical protein